MTTNEKIDYLKTLNLTPISTTYSDNLEVQCNVCNNTFKRAFSSIKRGNIDCPKCIDIRKINFLNSIGFVPTSESLGHDLEVQCKYGHIFKREYTGFTRGRHSCPGCYDSTKVEYLESVGLTPKSIKMGGTLEVVCDEGHTFKRPFYSINRGTIKCPICFPFVSSEELELRLFLDSLGVEYIGSDNQVLKGKEIDILIPKHNLAIEFNGIYYHSELNGMNKRYHVSKTNTCEAEGIELLQIWNTEWTYSKTKKEIWKSIIKNKLGKNEKIFARKCKIAPVIKVDEQYFLNNNHLQGFVGSLFAYGLYFNDELVAMMSFGKDRMGGKEDWELLRFAVRKGINVIGGASRIFKYFTNKHPGTIVSYSDKRYSMGKLYRVLGFDFIHNSSANYFYFKTNNTTKILDTHQNEYNEYNEVPPILRNRMSCQKHMIKKFCDLYDDSLTEWENMQINGYDRIWDCGNGVWVYTPNVI
jgi:hypothetical protein